MKRLLPFKALLFDLDGVITDTRDIHFKAWKKLFDQLLYDKGRSESFTEEDYRHYLDGKPREDGITSFLDGHQLHISQEEFLRLAAIKNDYFISILQEQGIRAFPDFLKLWEDLQDYHIKKAVVSSSENCRLILNNLGIEKKFDCIIDGKYGKKMMLKGKPSPDYFLKAASILHLVPQECAVIEDALNGVEAAKKGNFQTVYGISRKGSGYMSELKEAGADKIIKNLSEIIRPPNALSSLDGFFAETGSKELAIFLDYDGTLSEIVSRPEDAVLRTGAKSILNALSRSLKLAIVSGRDRIDVKERVGVDDIFYAGSHGFDMSGPGCFRYHYEGLGTVLKELEDATLSANNILTQEEGVHIERKAYGTAIHYRLAPPPSEKILRSKISQLLRNYSHLKLKEGKKVFELIPDVEWGKGKAVEKLIDILGVDTNSFIPLYIGDDTTDEDAFTALQGKGISIRVDDDEEVKTHADFSLKNPEEVVRFLNCVLKEYAGDDKRWRCGN